MMKKAAMLLRAAVTLVIWLTGAYILQKYEYLTAFGDVDNLVGMIPVAFVLTAASGMTFLLWAIHTKKRPPVAAVVTLFVILSVVLFPTALRGNWWIHLATRADAQASPDLTVYAPFSEGSQTAKLGEEAALRLDAPLPVLDGATALYPLYAAFAEAVYEEDAFTEEHVLCTNTRGAYEAIIAGERDIVFVAGASEKQMAAAAEVGADLHFTAIGHEAFVFLAGKENPIENITCQQIRNIYSGKTARWSTLGWPEGGAIVAFQRPEGSGSQTGLQGIMGGLPIQAPQPLPDASLVGTNSLMKQISAEWQGVQPAIGYSYRYYATTMYANPDTKFLSVNGMQPSVHNIQNKSYPFVGDFYAVTNGAPEGNVRLLIDWILSPQGQEIIEKTGYTPLI